MNRARENHMKAIINGILIIPDNMGGFQPTEDKVVLFEDTITDIIDEQEFYKLDKKSFEEIIDAHGKYISPGFVNIHIHGCLGADTMDCSAEGLKKMAECQASTGVTSMLPTTMTYDLPTVYKALEQVKAGIGFKNGSRIIGANMEGPFISEKYKGAQKGSNIKQADFKLIEKYRDVIKIITIAPETLPAGSDFIQKCLDNDIKVSIGHSAADYDCALDAITNKGVTQVTHLFNAMTGLHHRNPGIVGAALNTDAFCELIVDNIHIAPGAQLLVNKIKGTNRTVLITDSMRACGLGDGKSELGGQTVLVKGQKATLEDGTIAGSVLTMDRAVYNYSQNVEIPLWKAVECASITPARAIGRDNEIGSIEIGKKADFTIFDENVNIAITIRDGKTIFFD